MMTIHRDAHEPTIGPSRQKTLQSTETNGGPEVPYYRRKLQIAH
ncbi:MAG: hypothetical protein U9Q61_05715 [Thermodesulfobacteriota bacterium]|nr:hypothetical protein [Thermodesulfobacteriota bacterium]